MNIICATKSNLFDDCKLDYKDSCQLHYKNYSYMIVIRVLVYRARVGYDKM